MKRISTFLYRISTGRVALLCFVIFLLFSIITLPGQSRLAELHSKGAGSPDTSLLYSGDQLYQMAGMYGEEGRQAYLHARWTFDLAFPVIYTAFLVTSISWFLKKLPGKRLCWKLLNLVPVDAMVFDFLENTSTSLVFSSYPQHNLMGEALAPVFTPIKWLLVSLSFLILIYAILMKIFSLSKTK